MKWYSDIFTNLITFGIYFFILLYFMQTVVHVIRNRRNMRLSFNVILMVATLLLWLFSIMLRCLVSEEHFIYILFLTPYIFSSLAIVIAFFYVLSFYDLGVFCSKALIAVSLVVPAVTAVVIVLGFGEWFGGGFGLHLIKVPNGEGAFISAEPLNGYLHYVYGDFGMWHYMCNAYYILLAFCATMILVIYHRRLPKIYREPSTRLIFAVSFIFAGLVAQIILGEMFPLDFNLLGFILASRFFYMASLGNHGLVFLSQARSDIINFLEQGILILDEDKNITYSNKKGAEWLESLSFGGKSYPALLKLLHETATQCEQMPEDDGGYDFYFDDGESAKTYNLREKPICDNLGRQIGAYIIYSDVTENRALIQRLEVGAGRDALTGLHNRGMMEHLKTELDKPDSLPFSVIVCDLNDLKNTNDTFGHQQGDIMLRVAGDVISELRPPVAQAGRIGGDEFLILMPQTAPDDAGKLVEAIRERLRMVDEYPYKIVLSMGVGVKTEAGQDLNEAVKAADEAMYDNKRAIQGSVRSKVGAAV